MKTTLALIISFFISSNIWANELEVNQEVSAILGEIILYEDYLYRYGNKGSPGKAEQHIEMIEQGYEQIKAKYPERVQIDFLWSVMVRSSFGSHPAEMFVDLIHRCCNRSYLDELNSYLAQDRKYNKTMTKKAEYIKHFLDQRNRIDAKN